MQNFQDNLFEATTPIPCNIHEVSLREFLKICRTEYLKTHNIEDKSFFKKDLKTIENDVFEKIEKTIGQNKTKHIYFNNFHYRSYFRLYTRNVLNLACSLYDKQERDMNIRELEEVLQIIKELHQYTVNRLLQHTNEALSWINEKENIDMESTINTKSARGYIEKYFTQEEKTKLNHSTLIKMTNWVKFTQPVKTLEFPVKDKQSRSQFPAKSKPRRFREYYSKALVNDALALCQKIINEHAKATA